MMDTTCKNTDDRDACRYFQYSTRHLIILIAKRWVGTGGKKVALVVWVVVTGIVVAAVTAVVDLVTATSLGIGGPLVLPSLSHLQSCPCCIVVLVLIIVLSVRDMINRTKIRTPFPYQ
jgi:hypothetical protein